MIIPVNVRDDRSQALASVMKGLFIFLIGLATVGGSLNWMAMASPLPYQISIEGWSPYFLPKTAQVEMGRPIVWRNPTATVHTITHDGCGGGVHCAFDSGAIPPDGRFELPSLPAGVYTYHCTLHPVMRGVLLVQASAPSI